MTTPQIEFPSSKPIVLSMGDPAGIGPEIIVKAFRERPSLMQHVVVAGDVATVRHAMRLGGGACSGGHALPHAG